MAELCTLRYYFFGFETLEVDNPLFLFVIGGCLGSVALALFVQNRIRDTVFLLTLLSILGVILFGLKHSATHILFVVALILPLYFFCTSYAQKA